jgi:hypothetical protein
MLKPLMIGVGLVISCMALVVTYQMLTGKQKCDEATEHYLQQTQRSLNYRDNKAAEENMLAICSGVESQAKFYDKLFKH